MPLGELVGLVGRIEPLGDGGHPGLVEDHVASGEILLELSREVVPPQNDILVAAIRHALEPALLREDDAGAEVLARQAEVIDECVGVNPNMRDFWFL